VHECACAERRVRAGAGHAPKGKTSCCCTGVGHKGQHARCWVVCPGRCTPLALVLQQVLRIYVLSMVQTSVPPGACKRAHPPGLLGRSRARTPLLSQTGAGVLTRGDNPALRIRASRPVTAARSR